MKNYLEMQTTHADANPYKRLLSAWVPNTCVLELFPPELLIQTFRGKHFHFVGDSTTRQFISGVMRLFGFLNSTAEVFPRDYDSEGTYSTRFSVNWVGAAELNGNCKGLVSIVDNPDRFLNMTKTDADFVVMSAGTHEVAGDQSIEEYHRSLPLLFDMLLEKIPKIAEDRRRFVWRTPLPLINNPLKQFKWPNGICTHEDNAALQWLKLLSVKEAFNYGFPVLDAYRVSIAEDFDLSVVGVISCTWEGVHYINCDSHILLSVIYIHYVMQLQLNTS